MVKHARNGFPCPFLSHRFPTFLNDPDSPDNIWFLKLPLAISYWAFLRSLIGSQFACFKDFASTIFGISKLPWTLPSRRRRILCFKSTPFAWIIFTVFVWYIIFFHFRHGHYYLRVYLLNKYYPCCPNVSAVVSLHVFFQMYCFILIYNVDSSRLIVKDSAKL